MQLHKKSLIFGLIIGSLLLLATWYLTRPQGTLEFALAPESVQLTINDKPQTIQHKQKLSLSPGTYELTFSRDEFDSQTETVIVEKGETERIVMALTPKTDAARELINSNAESRAVAKEYTQVKYDKLIVSLPLSGVGYQITACPSLKKPSTDAKAICISTTTANGEQAALTAIRQFGYDTDELELLIGTETIKSVIKADSFTIDWYTNVDSEHSDKPSLFVTPLNVPFVPYNTANNPQLESIRDAALEALKENGYDIEKYDIVYSNIYLSKYNPHSDDPSEHAMPPITNQR